MHRLHYADPERGERETREEAERLRFQAAKRTKRKAAKRKAKAYSASHTGDYLAKPPNEID